MAMGMAAPCTGVSRPLARGLGVARASGVQRGPIERQAPPGGAPPAAERDPEGLFKGVPMRDGAIARRMLQKRVEVDQDFAKAMASAGDDLRKEQLLRRETRRVPGSDEELVEFFLNTMAEDLEFEVARFRPRLTESFFRYLDNVLGAERFAAKPDEDKLAELDLLRRYLAEASEAVDKCVAATSSAAERMKKLLMSKDKKQMILDMAAANEIDQALMDLLTQNIDAAKAAEQEEPARFMEKVRNACSKFFVSATAASALPQAPAQLGTRASGVPLLGSAAGGAGPNTMATVMGAGSPPAGADAGQGPAAGSSPLILPGKPQPSVNRQANKLLI